MIFPAYMDYAESEADIEVSVAAYSMSVLLQSSGRYVFKMFHFSYYVNIERGESVFFLVNICVQLLKYFSFYIMD